MIVNHADILAEVKARKKKGSWIPSLTDIRGHVCQYITDNYPELEISDIRNYPGCDDTFSPKNIEHLASVFRLSPFEKKVLLLCIASESDSALLTLYSRLNHNFSPSFSFAKRLFPETSHSITTTSPLRLWHLISLQDTRYVWHTPIQVTEKIMHYASGTNAMDEKLMEILQESEADPKTMKSFPFLRDQFRTYLKTSKDDTLPIQLQSRDVEACEQAAQYFALKTGQKLYKFSLEDLPAGHETPLYTYRLIAREVLLDEAILWIDCKELCFASAERYHQLYTFLQKITKALPSKVILSAHSPLSQKGCAVKLIVLKERTVPEQTRLWKEKLNKPGQLKDEALNRLSQQFKLSLRQTDTIARQWNQWAEKQSTTTASFDKLWSLCRQNLRREGEQNVKLITSKTHMKDLVLDAVAKHQLNQLLLQARNSHRVYEDWDFAGKTTRGLGITALFTGPPGTGKTSAAEAIANELNMDLLQIDLSQTVSKYIGETEKNLDNAFYTAYKSGAILLFDEADALFSKRMDVRDSHDMHANQQLSYLLQRIETHKGISLLTTNLKSSIDDAFMRRIRFVIPFELPQREDRYKIWRSVFPVEMPCENLDYEALAHYTLSGGEIRNAALNAAFSAADQEVALNMSLIDKAIREEFKKNQKAVLTD